MLWTRIRQYKVHSEGVSDTLCAIEELMLPAERIGPGRHAMLLRLAKYGSYSRLKLIALQEPMTASRRYPDSGNGISRSIVQEAEPRWLLRRM